jgi:hypothetical protein
MMPSRHGDGVPPNEDRVVLPDEFNWHISEHCNWRMHYSHHCRMCRESFTSLDQMINGWLVCEACFLKTMT